MSIIANLTKIAIPFSGTGRLLYSLCDFSASAFGGNSVFLRDKSYPLSTWLGGGNAILAGLSGAARQTSTLGEDECASKPSKRSCLERSDRQAHLAKPSKRACLEQSDRQAYLAKPSVQASLKQNLSKIQSTGVLCFEVSPRFDRYAVVPCFSRRFNLRTALCAEKWRKFKNTADSGRGGAYGQYVLLGSAFL